MALQDVQSCGPGPSHVTQLTSQPNSSITMSLTPQEYPESLALISKVRF